MSRRYPTAELYEERERDFYGGGGRRGNFKEYEELDIDISRGAERSRGPDFLREDYGRSQAGPLVVRERERERERERDDSDFDRRSRGPPRREVEKEEIIIKDRRGPERERPRDLDRDEVMSRRSGFVEDDRRSRRRAPSEHDETDINIDIRRSESRGPPRSRAPTREVERDEIEIRRTEREAPPPPRSRAPEREVEIDEIRFRRGAGSRGPPPPPPPEEKEEIIIRHNERDDRSRGGREHDDTVIIRGRERSQPPPRLVAREVEEFTVRRRVPSPSPPPPPPPQVREEQIIIRRRERTPSPSPSPSPPPPPPPPQIEPIIRPPIIQEVITHHRHIDHGVERARSPSPPPPPPSPPKEKEDTLEIAIRSRDTNGDTRERDIIFERETHDHGRGREEEDLTISRRRTASLPRGPPARPRPADMWTEVTKDLVLKEAIDAYGFDYEETPEYFYVMEYLRYEDVLKLVELSDDIRKDRRARIREIQYEREDLDHGRRAPERKPDRVYEREIYYDRRGNYYR